MTLTMSSSINIENVALQSIRTKPSEEIRLSSRRHLSHEYFPIVDTSFDVYYRESSVGVPFLWESQPGTPKIKSRESPLMPPLTPPPSFHGSPLISRKPLKKQPRNNLVTTVLLPKLNLKKTQFQQSPSRSISSSSPWSLSSSPLSESNQRRISSPPRMSFDSRFGSRIEEDECDEYSPVSTLCFRGGRGAGGRSRGCSSSIIRLLLGEFS